MTEGTPNATVYLCPFCDWTYQPPVDILGASRVMSDLFGGPGSRPAIEDEISRHLNTHTVVEMTKVAVRLASERDQAVAKLAQMSDLAIEATRYIR